MISGHRGYRSTRVGAADQSCRHADRDKIRGIRMLELLKKLMIMMINCLRNPNVKSLGPLGLELPLCTYTQAETRALVKR